MVNTAGGTVVAAGTSDGAVLVSASPAEGFAVSVEMAGPPEVEVHFEGDGVTYRVRIEVENGAFEVDVDVDD